MENIYLKFVNLLMILTKKFLMVKIISIELISQLDISQLMSVRVCQLLIISLCQTFHYYVRLSVVRTFPE